MMSEIDIPRYPNIIDDVGPKIQTLSQGDQQQLQGILDEGWRLTPATMAVKLTQGRWIAAKHLQYISTIVASEIAKGGARIIVTMPPRHGKSEFLSVNTSTWFLENWPDKYVMGISYGLELATDFSLKVRTNFLNEDLHHLLSTRLRRDKLKIDRFLTTEDGGYTAAGVGGTITGRGADLLFIDDYIKNAEAALSLTQRQSSWDWLLSTAWTRLEPNSSIIILATRWDVDDLIGRCLTEMPDENWILINLPAIAGLNDPIGRAEGEALWPDRYNLEALNKIKGVLGNYWWSAMYQQDPLLSMSGAMLGERLRIIDEADLPHESTLKDMRIWDLAATQDDGDYTAGPKMSLQSATGKIFIKGMDRFQKSPEGMEIRVKTAALVDGPGVPIWMEQEPGSAGVIVLDHYKREVLSGWSLKGEKPTGPVEVRAQPFLAAVERGDVYIVRDRWNKALIDEINAFPDGDNDDQVSSLALGYHKLMKGRMGGLTWGRSKKKDTARPDDASPINAKKPYVNEDKKIIRLTWK